MMTNVPVLPQSFEKQIYEQAAREYPRECCGMIFAPVVSPGAFSRARACRNVYDEYHAKDPENFPRTARTAYFIDPKELLLVQRELRERSESLRIIYHSHIDTGAYFSEEDMRMAAPEGEPAWPGTDYLVLSVTKGEVREARLYRWDPAAKRFVS